MVNNSIGTLRAVLDEAISTGARFNNPAAKLSRVKLRQKKLELPSREEFLKFVEEIRTAGARQSKDCADLVQFLAYSGLRIDEAKYVTWPAAGARRPATIQYPKSMFPPANARICLCGLPRLSVSLFGFGDEISNRRWNAVAVHLLRRMDIEGIRKSHE